MGPFVLTQFFTNSMVNVQCGAIQIKYNIRLIISYKYNTKVNESENKSLVVYFFLKSRISNKVYDWIQTGTLLLIHILYAHKFCIKRSFFHNRLHIF